MPFKPALHAVLLSLLFSVSFASLAAEDPRRSQVRAVEDLQWGYLNPARGAQSPGAADLWGDRTKAGASGMLVRFEQGFSSPPHIHNITYRGVVIEGLLHNDDPAAQAMWMPRLSYWTQPAGEVHITAADGSKNMIYLEIDSGPYLVEPGSERFDNGERPVNIHSANLVWKSSDELVDLGGGVEAAFLYASKTSGQRGTLLKLPGGFDGRIHSHNGDFKGVVIQGTINYSSAEEQLRSLAAGSYFASSAEFGHEINTAYPAVIFVRSQGRYSVE